ncbi:MAG TPA: MarR family transcriptional regulator [Armatimonadaceae bacterium]|nr:MarR family transcriptional regulator [Armatimonadaceae bacterium]
MAVIDERTKPAQDGAAAAEPGRGELSRKQRQAWAALFEAHGLVLRRIDADLEREGIGSLAEYDVLYVLYQSPERRLRLAELADQVLISRSGLTRLVDRLEARGFLRRESCPEDRRGSYAVVTDAGVEELRRIWAFYARGVADYFMRHLDAQETDMVARVFGKVRDALREEKAKA